MKTKRKFKIKINPLSAILFVILLAYAFSMLFTLLWGFMTSLKHFTNFRVDAVGFPDFSYWTNSTIEGEDKWYSNYVYAWKRFEFKLSITYFEGIFNPTRVSHRVTATFLSSLGNTLLYAGGSSVLITFTSCITAYMCSKYRNHFSKIVYAVVVFVLVLPLFGTTPAMITLLRQLRLYDSHIGMWITSISFANMYFLIFHASFQGVSDTYAEAAEIDGASQFRILVSIELPLVSKMIATSILLHFVTYWNDYNTSLLYLRTKPTLAYAVYRASQVSFGGQTPKKVAALMMLAMPVLILFVIFKDKFMGNVSLGGLKE